MIISDLEYGEDDEHQIGHKSNDSRRREIVKIFIVGFVIEEIPLRNEIVFLRAKLIIGVGKSFDSGSKQRMGFPNVNCSPPDDFAYLTRFGAAAFQSRFLRFIGLNCSPGDTKNNNKN